MVVIDHLFLLPPINALLLNLNDGLRETLLISVGVFGKVNPFPPLLSVDCLSPPLKLFLGILPSIWSPLGDEATAIDAIPLLGVPFEGKTGIDGGGIIEVDW